MLDDTNEVVFYYSQKALHKRNPQKYKSEILDWVTGKEDKLKEKEIILGTENDDFKWYKYKRSKMFLTLRDSKGNYMSNVSVDVRFKNGKKFPTYQTSKQIIKVSYLLFLQEYKWEFA